MSTDTPPLCINCTHYRAAEKEIFDRCAHPAAQNGFIRSAEMQYCAVMRVRPCGKEAKLFQARQPTEPYACPICSSKGFAPSKIGTGCTFCDGTEGGQPS